MSRITARIYPQEKNKLKNLVSRYHCRIFDLSASALQGFRDAQVPILMPETQTGAWAQAYKARITKVTAPSPTRHKVSHIRCWVYMFQKASGSHAPSPNTSANRWWHRRLSEHPAGTLHIPALTKLVPAEARRMAWPPSQNLQLSQQQPSSPQIPVFNHIVP